MRILVTGHKGYIGSALVPLLVDGGHDVVGVDIGLFAPAVTEALAGIPDIPKDVRDLVRADLEGFDAVVHLAALSNDPVGNLDPELTYQINYHSSVRLASIAKAAGVGRFLFSSSCSNYGAAVVDHLMTEESPLNPVTAYGKSKVMAEQAVRELASASFSPVFLRNATAYGVAPCFRTDLVVNNLMAWAYTTGQIRILSDGTPWRPLVHVRDIAAGFVAAIEAPRQSIHNEVFNIGRTDENYQVRDIANIIASVMPSASIAYAPQAGPDVRDYRVSFEKAETQLTTFAPRWNVRRGAEELLDFYRRCELTVADVTGPRFVRIARVNQLLEQGEVDRRLGWRETTGKPGA